MANEFKIEVPINVKGTGGAGGSSGGGDAVKKELKKLNKNTITLNKTMFLNIDVIEILSSLIQDLFKILQPLFKLLSIMLLLVFLPLMPIYKTLIKVLGTLVSVIRKLNKPKEFIEEQGKGVAAIVGGILIAVGAVILFAVGGWIVVLLGVVAAIIVTFWEDIANFFTSAWNDYLLPAFQWIGNNIIIVGEFLFNAWKWFGNVPTFLWESIIRPSWEALKDIGSWIWDIIGGSFKWLADKIIGIWDFFGNIGGKAKGMLGFEKGGVVPGPRGSPQMAIVHGGETIISAGKSSGSITVNINNPSIRQTSDIKMLANEVSMVLQRQMSGRMSQ